MTTRPHVAIFNDDGKTVTGKFPLPAVFSVPIRNDIVE